MEAFNPADIFTAAGAVTAGALASALTELLKRLFHVFAGPAARYLAAGLALGLVGLGTWALNPNPVDANVVITIVVAWLGVTTAAIGTYEVASAAKAKVAGGE